MENPFYISAPDIAEIQIKKVKYTDRQHQKGMYAFCVKHPFGKNLSYGFHNFPCRKASCLHGGTDGHFIPQKHRTEQPVLTDNTACRQHNDRGKYPSGKLPVLCPQPDKRSRHIGQDKQAEIRKVRKKGIKK